MKNKLIISFCCLLMISCQKKNSISEFSFLQGKWVGSADGMSFFEEWNALSGDVMEGRGGAVSGADTVFSEKIRIEQRGEEIYYTPTVSENDGAVDFKFTGFKNDSIVFENPKHDFPQRIVYFRLPDNGLYACIDGLEAGKYKRIEFPYRKAQ